MMDCAFIVTNGGTVNDYSETAQTRATDSPAFECISREEMDVVTFANDLLDCITEAGVNI